MAINYTEVGWDTTKYVNPTNMNQMDDGIKAACDGVDELNGATSDIVNILGAKNLLPYPYYHTTRTTNGITYTDNGDGSITVSGTSSKTANFYLTGGNYSTGLALPDGTYKFSLSPTSSLIRMIVNQVNSDNTYEQFYVYGGEELSLTTSSDYRYVCILQVPGSGVNFTTPITFYPMLRPASVKDSTYAPYAMTNKELTDAVKCNQTTAGTYTLQATVASNGTVTYSWV